MTDIKEELLRLFAASLVDAADVYVSAMKRLTLSELLDVAEYISLKKYEDLRDFIRSEMTAEELAVEKSSLAELLERMADKNYKNKSMIKQLMLSVFKIALSSAIGAII